MSESNSSWAARTHSINDDDGVLTASEAAAAAEAARDAQRESGQIGGDEDRVGPIMQALQGTPCLAATQAKL